MNEHRKYIYQTCEYCTEWTRPTNTQGNAEYIRHVITHHLQQAMSATRHE